MDRFVRIGEPIARTGYVTPRRRRPGRRRARALVQLIAAVGLVMSLAVAATAVSIGIARAQVDTGATVAAAALNRRV